MSPWSPGSSMKNMPIKVDVVGGNPGLKRFLTVLDLDNPEENGRKYDDWASSVRDFPQIIEQKVRKTHSISILCSFQRKEAELHTHTHTHTWTVLPCPRVCRSAPSGASPLRAGKGGGVCRREEAPHEESSGGAFGSRASLPLSALPQ